MCVRPDFLVAFGSTKRADYVDGGDAWKEYDSLRETEPNHEAAAAMLAVAQVWIKRLNIQGSHTVAAQAEDARKIVSDSRGGFSGAVYGGQKSHPSTEKLGGARRA